jgi:hypothetical protein
MSRSQSGIQRTLPGGLVILAIYATFSCGGQQVPVNDLRLTPPEKGPPQYDFDTKFHNVMRFQQGVEGSYDIAQAAHVPPPGRPELTISGLPKEAHFDGKVLTWSPPCEAEAGFYVLNWAERHVVVTLKSSLDPDQFVQEGAVLLVREFEPFEDVKCGELTRSGT